MTNEKMQALRNIYSDYRLDQSGGKRTPGGALSPQNNNMTFEASRILDMQQRAADVRTLIENQSANAERGSGTPFSNVTPSTAYKRTKTPGTILEGKYR